MVFRFLAVMIFGLLLLGVVRLAFDQHPRPGSKVETPSDMRTSVARNPKYSNSSSPVGRAFDPQPPNVLTAGVEPDEPGTVSLSIMKVCPPRVGGGGGGG